MSRTLCAVVAVSLAFVFGGTAGGSPLAERTVRTDRREPNLALMRFTEQLAALGVPPSFLDDFLAEQRMTGTFSYSLPAGDLNGDGSEDIFGTTIEYEVTFDDTLFLLTGIEMSGRSEVSALSGRSGKVLWQRDYDDFTVPVPATVGRNHRVGALLIGGLDTLVGPVNDRYLQIEALVGSRPNRLWSVSYRSQIVQQGLTYVAHNVPLSLGLFDGLPGGADDLLVGVGEVASAGVSYVVSSQAHVIDGRSGDERVHPTVDVGVNWYPDPVPVGDLNDDRRDDYVVTVNPAL
nr:hypothetical protein [Actinomycetota bacterium]